MTSALNSPRRRPWRLLFILGALLVAGAVGIGFSVRPSAAPPPLPPLPPSVGVSLNRQITGGPRLRVLWDAPGTGTSTAALAGGGSNVHPADYAGADTCKECHPKNHASWSRHPHRHMNALAGEATVVGDFSDNASMAYRGGRATFRRDGATFVMRLERGDVRRTYRINQTIGWRFFQYYVGRQTDGPEPPDHHFYRRDHVLPFGWWIDRKEWVPIVHVGPERPDADRPDPYQPPDSGRHYADYAVGCNHCHTTFPLGDQFARAPEKVGEQVPVRLAWALGPYLEQARPSEAAAVGAAVRGGSMDRPPMLDWEAPAYAVNLGVSCEACHLGAKEHVASGGKVPPRFFPSSPNLYVEGKGRGVDFGRSHANVNWACGRCHVGSRPTFAAGMSTWNSVEYSDAMRGACYSKLRCVDCHDPHTALGPAWTHTPDQDDATCLKCHPRLEPAAARAAHTHHPAGSAGARCLNCHMPRINEGLNGVVRTHMMTSPTRADMIEANHPNACNLCHTDKPIDWTLDRLRDWYGAKVDAGKIAAAYPERDRPVALGWLRSENDAVRLVAADALTRAGDRQALPALLDALDDPYLVNRQFTAKGLEAMLSVRLDQFGYRFYMTAEERRGPLAALRVRFAPR